MDFDQTANAMSWTQMQTSLKSMYQDAAKRGDAKGMVETSKLLEGLEAKQSEAATLNSVIARQDHLMNVIYPGL